MRAHFSEALRRYGTPLVLQRNGEETALRGFLQSVRAAGTHKVRREELGARLPGEAVYLGPPEIPVDGGVLLRGTERWRVRRWETVYVADEAVYLWAALTREGEVDSFV